MSLNLISQYIQMRAVLCKEYILPKRKFRFQSNDALFIMHGSIWAIFNLKCKMQIDNVLQNLVDRAYVYVQAKSVAK